MGQFPDTSLLPVPADLTYGEGYLRLEGEIRIALTGVREPRIARASERFAQYLREETGSSVSLASGETDGARVVVAVDGECTAEPGTPEDEAYTLTVSPSNALLEARKVSGALHGLQTLQQLLVSTPDGYRVPVVRIVDQPRFPWRGLLIDAVRHWLPPEVIAPWTPWLQSSSTCFTGISPTTRHSGSRVAASQGCTKWVPRGCTTRRRM